MEENIYSAEEESIDLRDLWFVFRQHLIGILMAAAVIGFGVFAFCRFVVTPTYSATSKLYIVSASSDSVVNLSDLQIGSNLTADYQELLLSRPVMESVIKKLNIPLSADLLRDKISIENPKSTRILKITATTGDAQLSADIANTVARLAVTWLPEVMECNAPHIAEEAIVTNQKAGPHTVRNAVLGAVVSGVLAYFVYLVAFLMDDSIVTSEDMERYFNLIPLASIPLAPELKHRKEELGKSKHLRGKRTGKGGAA